MRKTSALKSILENLLFVWIGLSIILFIGGESLVLPEWIQVLGRSHPLVLHFPIVLILLGLFSFWAKEKGVKEILELIFVVGVNFAGYTVIAGLILAQEDYSGESLSLHKNAGMIVFLLGSVLYFLRSSSKAILKVAAGVLTIGLVLTGHWGADLTHGENFLLAPVIQLEEPEVTPLAEAEVFRDVVQPILNSKCIGCHKEGKVKGKLRLDNVEGMLAGGKSGALLIPGNADSSLLLQRIHIPLEVKKHMPPKNKAQLSQKEKDILTEWVLAGASFDQKLQSIPEEENLFRLASSSIQVEEVYTFKAAGQSTINDLNNFFRKVEPIFPTSPGLVVSYFGISAFDESSLRDLGKIEEQIIQLNMNKMPLENVDFSWVANLTNLKELQLNFTDIGSSQLAQIAYNKSLQQLSISGNQLDDESLEIISSMSQLKELYVWQTGLNESQKEDLERSLRDTYIDFGFDSKKYIYELNAPQIVSENDMFGDSTKIEITHPINTVEIRYSLDGSEPDSISSEVYSEPFWVHKTAEIKARVFAEEWKGSPENSTLVFRAGNPPAELTLITQPNPNYFGKGNETLIDQVKGKNNHTSGEWLGYKDQNAEFEISLAKDQKPKEITISMLYHEGAYIFPPTQVEIWIDDASGWKKVIDKRPEKPGKILPSRFEALSYPLPDQEFSKIKVRLKRIEALPAWHPGAGSKGWVFLDEVSLLE